MDKIRVRFAPSPTGYLHIGGLRSALYNFLFAKKNKGTFILKIEDTDQKRYVEGATESLIRSLDWAGLVWDEGVFLDEKGKIEEKGERGPYIQSKNLEVYKKYAEQLVKDGHAYYCFCEPERLETMRSEQVAKKQAPLYDRYCLRNLKEEEINGKLKDNCSCVIRLKVPDEEIIEVEDIIRGKVRFNTKGIDDQVLLKSDGFPTYHLASVIDDHRMETTHVIRGEEWLPSLPKHVLLYRYFGWEMPQFAHLPLLVNADRTKLSKRQGDVAVEDYINKGYLKEVIINFVALLGWNPGEGSTQEIFSMQELVEKFELAKVHKAGAVFDLKKLDWINGQYIKKMEVDGLYANALPFFAKKEFYISWNMEHGTWNEKDKEEYLKKVLAVEKERLVKFSDVGEENKFFFQDVKYDKELLRWKDMSDEKLKKSLETSLHYIKKIPDEKFNHEEESHFESELFAGLKQAMEEQNMKTGDLLWPLRVALTGAQKSPSPFEVAWVLGKSETAKRILQALELF